MRYCEGVIEAGWLAALVCVPLFYQLWGTNLGGNRSHLLHALSIVVLASWIIGSICKTSRRADGIVSERSVFRSLLTAPLMAPIALFVGVLIISTLFSLSPWMSFWGVEKRGCSSYTSFCCILFFAAILFTIRSEEQVERIITLIILTSIPICLYGIEQQYSLGPLPSNPDRVGSTVSNPALLAAYLIMVAPLTVSRAILRCWTLWSGKNRRPSDLVQAALYGLALVLEIWAIISTIGRAAILGLMVGFFVMLLVWAIYRRQRWVVFGIIGAGILFLAALIVLSRPTGPFKHLMNNPFIYRFSSILGPQTNTSGRDIMWQMAAQASRFSRLVEVGGGRQDPFSGARFLVGYGPETGILLCRTYKGRVLNEAASAGVVAEFDRFHNDFWDAFITTGLLGVSAYLALTSLVFYFACRWLGLISSARHRAEFWLFFVGGGLIGTLAFVAWRGMGFLGLGLRLGTIGGLLAYLMWVSWRKEFDSTTQGVPVGRALIIAALLASLVAHLVEISFSFETSITLLYFWIYLALLLVIGDRRSSMLPTAMTEQAPAGNRDSMTENRAVAGRTAFPPKKRRWLGVASQPAARASGPASRAWRSELICGLLMALFLINFYLFDNPKPGTPALQMLVERLTSSPSFLVSTLGIFLLLAVMLTNESRNAIPRKPWLASLSVTLAVAAALGLIYWVAFASHLGHLLPASDVTLENLDRFRGNQVGIVDFYYGFLLALILLTALVLSEPGPVSAQKPAWQMSYCGVASLIAAGALAIVYTTDVRWTKVNAMEDWAHFFKNNRQWPVAAALLEGAIEAAPKVDHQYAWLGLLLKEQAAATEDALQRQALLQKADHVYERWGKIKPINYRPPALRGDLHRAWAEREQDQDRRIRLGTEAMEFYRQAAALDPGNDSLWYQMGFTAFKVLNSPDKALPHLLHSRELLPKSDDTHALLGDTFFQKGVTAQDSGERENALRAAVTNYQQAVKLVEPRNTGAVYRYNLVLGNPLVELGDLSGAIAAFQSALQVAPAAERWTIEETLGRLYSATGDTTKSSEHFQRAIDVAPSDKRAGLINLRNSVLARP
jgi:tetratricopeptide (TPR) repeat protein